MRWAFLIAVVARAAEPGYVDPVLCRNCHAAIYDSYSKTGMALTFGPAAEVPALDEFVHALSRRSYKIEKRGDDTVMTRFETGGGNRMEKRIDYAIGSGARSRTYVHRAPGGALLELPVSWYAENGGYWAMSPGYDRPDHSDFRREVSAACLFCHNGYPSEANRGLASGIDCQRCHGPGENHARRGGPILNPAKLPLGRRMEACLQCHLESASRTLPDAVRRFGRSTFSYRPSEPLSAYQLYFDFARPPDDDRITVNNSGYGLMQSACFRNSRGRLECVSCHDPHHADTPAASYTRTCRGCHASSHSPSTTDCAGCHMPKRRTEDAVHVVMTDHFIRRRPARERAGEMIVERHDRQTGLVRPLYPTRLSEESADRLYLAIAQVQRSSAADADRRKLGAAIRGARPAAPEPYVVLGDAHRNAGQPALALEAYRQALARGCRETRVYVALAEVLMALDRIGEAISLLEPKLRDAGSDVPVRNTLAVLYGRQGRFQEAVGLLEEAARLAPDDPVTWLNLGVSRQALGQKDRAEAAYREAIRLQPDLTRARQYLQALLKDQL